MTSVLPSRARNRSAALDSDTELFLATAFDRFRRRVFQEGTLRVPTSD